MTPKWIYITALTLLLTACGNEGFVSVIELPGERFDKAKSIEFDFEQTDTQEPHKIELIIRHRPDFEYRTIRLEVRTISPLRKYWTDTVDIPLTSDNGQWRGVDRDTHIDQAVIYRKGVQFETAGQYNIRIRHLNETDSLSHLMAIGLIVEKE